MSGSIALKLYYDNTTTVTFLNFVTYNLILVPKSIWKYRKQIIIFTFGDNLLSALAGIIGVVSGLVYLKSVFGGLF